MRKAILFLILLLAAAPALAAERFARQGADEVRVFDSPCVSVETMNRIRKGGAMAGTRPSGALVGSGTSAAGAL